MRNWLISLIMVAALAAVGCGNGDSSEQKEAVPEATKGRAMPSITASFDNRVEFAEWLLEQARLNNRDGLMNAVAPFEYVLRLRRDKGFSEPTDQLRQQLQEKHREHYGEQVRRFVSRFQAADPERLELVDLGTSEFSQAEKNEVEAQTNSGIHSDYGDVVIVRGDTTYKLRLFRYKGSWYAAELGS